MTRYLLDTNIVSDALKPVPSPALERWMTRQDDTTLFIASLTVAEIHSGILTAPHGKKRDALEAWFSGPKGPQTLFSGRILSFDVRAALAWARLMADGRLTGRPRSGLDTTIIAAVAVSNDCIVVTDNERDFAGVDILNPLRD